MVIQTSRLLLTAALLGLSAPAFTQEQFGTPEAAVDALVAAARSGDGDAVLKVLGPDGKPIVSSGDPVADSNIRQDFVSAYDAKHSIETEGDGTQTLIMGEDDWPFPIPLVNRGSEWQFDTKAGLDEVLRRRIGRNELSTIQVTLAYVQAQNEYAALDPADLGRGVYAQRIVSHPAKKDGLYWPTAEGEELSPLGDLAAQAAAEGYRAVRIAVMGTCARTVHFWISTAMTSPARRSAYVGRRIVVFLAEGLLPYWQHTLHLEHHHDIVIHN